MTTSLHVLIEKLRAKNYSAGFAESCTGGLLSATMAAVPGVSDIFMGSVVCYSYDSKIEMLGVSKNVLLSDGAVNARVALQMAQGLRARMKTKCAVAITGVAGPSGGSPEKPVGLVWFAVIGPGFEETEKKLFTGTRQEIQKQAVDFAIEMFIKAL